MLQPFFPHLISLWGKVNFALKGICPHSLTHWIRFEKCANTHPNAKLLCDVCLHTPVFGQAIVGREMSKSLTQ